MPELKPVAWMWRCPQYCAEQGWHVSKKRPADAEPPATESYEDYPLHYIPDTHRIVSVDALNRIMELAGVALVYQPFGTKDRQHFDALMAIIEDKP